MSTFIIAALSVSLLTGFAYAVLAHLFPQNRSQD